MRILACSLIFNLVLICAHCTAQEIRLQKSIISHKTFRAEPTPYHGIHGFYKKYISSQDGANCQFYPSCSHYAKLAIKKYSLPIALFLSADRLLRCNGRLENYPINDSDKAIDHP